MTRYLTCDEVAFIHARVIEEHGGPADVLSVHLIESAVAAPQSTFGGIDFYRTIAAKAAALGFSLVMNHAFQDGNKRTGFVAMQTFHLLNDHSLTCTADAAEAIILSVCRGATSRVEFIEWVERHCNPRVLPPDRETGEIF